MHHDVTPSITALGHPQTLAVCPCYYNVIQCLESAMFWSHGWAMCLTHEDLVVSRGGICYRKSCGTLVACSCIALMLVLALASAGCLCSCTFVCTCICMGCIRFCMSLHVVAIVFALVLHLCLHLHCVCIAMLLALHWCCTWVAPMLECFVLSAFRKETLMNPHLLWHLLAVGCIGRCCWLPSLAVALALQP